MTIDQIAKRLKDCANKTYCKECPYSSNDLPTMTCEEFMIKYAAEECRKVADEMIDDMR